MKRSRRRKRITILVVIAVLAIVGVLVWFRIMEGKKAQARAEAARTIASAEVSKRDIRTTVVGNGTLKNTEPEKQELPKGIRIRDVYVEEGDIVHAGQRLATVDTGSVRDAVASLQEQLTDLDKELIEMEEERQDEALKAPVSGTVEAVYAEAGGGVPAIMEGSGALMLLRSDSGGKDVKISAMEGEVLELYVSVGDHVRQGDSLLLLRSVTDEPKRRQLLADREALSGAMEDLYACLKSPDILSEYDGVVRKVYVEEGELVKEPASSEGLQLGNLGKDTSSLDMASIYGGLGLMSADMDGGYHGASRLPSAPGQANAAHLTVDPRTVYFRNMPALTLSGEYFEDAPVEAEPQEGDGGDGYWDGGDAGEAEDGSGGGGGVTPFFLQGNFYLPVRVPAPGGEPMTAGELSEQLVGMPYSVEDLSWSDGDFRAGGNYTARVSLVTDMGNACFFLPDSNAIGLTAPGSNGYVWQVDDRDGDGFCEHMDAELYYSIPAAPGEGEPESTESGSYGAGQDEGHEERAESGTDTSSGAAGAASDGTAMDGSGTGASDASAGASSEGQDAPSEISTDTKDASGDSGYQEMSGGSGSQDGSQGTSGGGGGQATSGGSGSKGLSGGSASQDGGQGTSGGNPLVIYVPEPGQGNGCTLANLLVEAGEWIRNSTENLNNWVSDISDSLAAFTRTANAVASILENGIDLSKLFHGNLNLSALLGNGFNLSSMLGGGMDLSSLFGGASMGDLSSLAGLSSLEDLSGGFDAGSLLGSSSASSAAAAYAKAEAFSIGEEIKVDVVIAVTELDILQITAGQDATVTMDAIPGRSFEGQVKSIARSGSNTGGATKYDVTVELPYDPDMRVDMSCMVNILVGEADQVSVIPSAAVLTEQGKNYVYTSCTEEGVLGDKVEVETGLADGEYVEIKEGLEEGQRIYYRNKTMNLLETRMENMGSYYGQTENVSGV